MIPGDLIERIQDPMKANYGVCLLLSIDNQQPNDPLFVAYSTKFACKVRIYARGWQLYKPESAL